jgi:hypothetical protein
MTRGFQIRATLSAAAVAMALIATSSAAFAADKCAGTLHWAQDDIHFGGGRGEDESICVINKFEEAKVLAVCSVGRFCTVRGSVDLCKDSGECAEISNITSVKARR